MILGEAFRGQTRFTLAQHVTGWTYHFSNGITFGVMYVALIGEPARRNWMWAVLLAVGIELSMLFTPYTSFFGLGQTSRFVAATMSAHLIFGVTLGLYVRRRAVRWPQQAFNAHEEHIG